MRKKGGIYAYLNRLIILAVVFMGPGAAAITGSELSANFRLDILELAFTNGKYYRVTPQNNPGPSYYVTMQASGHGILKGKWLLDQQVIGLFEVFLHANNIVNLRGHRVPSLPTIDPGPHELTLAFTNYQFPRPIPILRYYVAVGGAIRIELPEPGGKVRIAADGSNSLQLQWKWENTGKQPPVFQLLVSDVPLHFFTEEQRADMWKEVGGKNQYILDLSPYLGKRKRKRNRWLYWQVRAMKPDGAPLTVSEISSFKVIYVKKTSEK